MSRSPPSLGVLMMAAITVLVSGCARAPAVSVEDPPGLGEARDWIVAGRYAEAEQRAREVLAAMEADRGASSAEAARALDVLVESLWRAGRSGEDGVLELAERALAIKQGLFGARHRELAPSLRNVAIILEDRGQRAEALPRYEQALSVLRRAHAEPKDVARALTDLGNLMLGTSRFADARPFYEEALKIQIRAMGEQDPEVARTWNNLGRLDRGLGDYEAARDCYERALAIREAALGPDSLDVAWTLNSLAVLAVETGAYDDARQRHERALAIREAQLGAEHPHVAWTLMNLGTLHRDTGDYVAARAYYERALAMQEKLLGPQHLDTAMTRANLAELFRLTGDLQEARKLHESVLAARRAALGPQSDEVGTSSYQLCLLLVQLGERADARSACEQAATIWERIYGPEHANYALALHGLGVVAEAAGELPAARRSWSRALEIREKAQGATHPDVAESLLELGRLDGRLGDGSSARRLLERSLAIREKVFGAGHPMVGEVLGALALEYARSGEREAALAAAFRAERIGVDHVRLTARAMAEREVLNYASARTSGLDVALSIAADGLDPAAARRVFELVIRSRALALDEMARRGVVARTASDPDLARLADAVTRARRRLANVTVRGPDPEHPERYRSLVESAAAEKDRAERALAERSSSFREERSRPDPGVEDIARARPPGFGLVSYVRYDRLPVTGSATEGVRSYLAFVQGAGASEARIVPLGAASEIENAVARWREQVAEKPAADPGRERAAEASCRREGQKLRRMVWDPVAPYVEGARGVIVVPAGALNLVNLSALPAGEEPYLIETAPTLHLVSAERDLVEPPDEGGVGLLAIGGPEFGAPLPGLPAGRRVAAEPNGHVPRGARPECGDFRSLVFEPLPGAVAEISEVTTLWSEATRGEPRATGARTVKLSGPAATEAAFEHEAPGRRVVHVATHGFFLGSGCTPSGGETRGIDGLIRTEEPVAPRDAVPENPLVLSGLALAGANRRAEAGPEGEDGILTAEEIAGLDLRGVEWAVLSACDTGRGELFAEEGVLGLRRAFQVAGARTVVMSLWAVGDEAAREWMTRLYRRRFVDGRNTADAVRDASLEVLLERRTSGRVTHPFYWGGFVASGDWR